MAKQKRWIQKVRKEIERKGTEGAFKRQLEIPKKKRIPKTLVEKIVKTPIGKTIKNPTKTGKRTIKVTRKLKKRAVFVLNVGYKKKK